MVKERTTPQCFTWLSEEICGKAASLPLVLSLTLQVFLTLKTKEWYQGNDLDLATTLACQLAVLLTVST